MSELVARAEAGESIRSIARDVGVANSALTRMLRGEGVVISKRNVSDNEAAQMAAEYAADATMAELEKKYELSHGAVFRALHRSGVETRDMAPRRQRR